MRHPSQALVEFALAIGVFMVLILGTFDLARYYLVDTVVTNAVRDAGRYAATHPDGLADAATFGKNLAAGIDTSALTLTVAKTTLDPDDSASQPYITVTGTYYPFQFLTPRVGELLLLGHRKDPSCPEVDDKFCILVDTSTPIG